MVMQTAIAGLNEAGRWSTATHLEGAGGLNPTAQAQVDAILAEAATYRRPRVSTPDYLNRLARAAELFQEAAHSRRAMVLLEEALSTSDFPILFGDIIDRTMLARYQEIPGRWRAFAKANTVPDFRQVRRIAIDGLEGRYIPSFKKPELTSVQEGDLSERGYTVSVDVYEKGISINWRMLINGQLMGAFSDIPDRLARGARRSEEFFAVSLFVSSTGPNATFFSNANGNIINTTNGAASNNPVLSPTSLQDAFTVLSNQRDADGEPIDIQMVTLVVPPALETTARNMASATFWYIGGQGQTGPGGVAGQQIQVPNWLGKQTNVVVEPYLPIIDTTHGNTAWYMFADPNSGPPALEVDHLAGYETPTIYRKAAEHERLGGGVDQMLGDWETMEIRYKGLLAIGGGTIDPKMAVASNGSAS